MTPAERLKNVIDGAKVDRPPCICPGGMMNMITADLMDSADIYMPAAHTDAGMMASLAKAAYEKECFENVGVPFCMTVEAETMGAEGTGKQSAHGQRQHIRSGIRRRGQGQGLDPKLRQKRRGHYIAGLRHGHEIAALQRPSHAAMPERLN
jgi:uroporphyrinogen-III decarboxylase